MEIEINGVRHPVPYGTARLDTEGACGDVDNGFGLLFNWNLLGDGMHDVVAVVDGVELDQATITVTTLGEEFPEGLEGEYILEGFPDPDTSVVIRWEESLQNFVIIDDSLSLRPGRSWAHEARPRPGRVGRKRGAPARVPKVDTIEHYQTPHFGPI